MKQDDLLSKLGSKTQGDGLSSAPSASSQSTETLIGSGSPTENTNRGADLLGKAGKSSKTVEATTDNTEPVSTSTATSDDTVSDPSTWTLESSLKEIKKLRQENQSVRHKMQEKVINIQDDFNKKLEAEKAAMAEALEAKKELEALKAKEEDKKRDLSERLAHREALLAQAQAEKEALLKQRDAELLQAKTLLAQFEAEKNAEMEVYQGRLNNELNKIPEQYKELAQKLVQGCSDSKEALVILTEANMKGMFEDKKVIVNHSVPGASTGARSSKERLEAAASEVRSNMSSTDKIKAGLDAIRGGEKNSAFRSR